ncbi:MAG: arylsulfatase, partial [Planctomycetota bacterium]
MKNLIACCGAWTAILLLPVAWATCEGAEKQPPRPNILFIFADDWGWGD